MMLEHYRGDRGSLTLARGVWLHGELDRDALQAAVDHVVARHEVLRTTYSGRGPRLMQHVHAPRSVSVAHLDASAATDPMATAIDELQQRNSVAFDLRSEWPLRVIVMRLGPDDHILCVAIHHIATDNWSDDVVWSELRTLYGQYATGQRAELDPPTWQYRDFVAWQEDRLNGTSGSSLRAYWSKQLDGAQLTLPPGGSTAPLGTGGQEAKRFGLSGPVADGLLLSARAARSTLFIFVVAALQLNLARLIGRNDVTVAAILANRVRPESRGMVGYCANLVLLRSVLDEADGLPEAVAKARVTVLGALQHQELPYHLLAGGGLPKGDPTRFRVQVVVSDVAPPPDFGPLTVVPWTLPIPIWSRKDIEVVVHVRPGQIEFGLLYGAGTVDEVWITSLAHALERDMLALVSA